ncbi:annexin A13-like isoform X2 [Paramacrobiotus metropolitanus]|nr:annexin A13-like isoform X2 [Paramacrobiotus metropolitanus]
MENKLELSDPSLQSENKDVPTIYGCPDNEFSAEADASSLYNAMKGLGTREKAIIDLLTHRSSQQRRNIAGAYKKLYGKELINAMKGELKILISGHFEDVLIALLKPPEVYDAEQIHHAIHLPLTDEDMVINIVCTRNNVELNAIKKAYTNLYDKDLALDISSHVHSSTFFKNLITTTLAANRDDDFDSEENDLEHVMVAVEQAKWDARALYDAGPKRWASDSTFIPLFTGRGLVHLRVVIQELEKLLDMPLEKVLATHLHGDVEKFLERFVKFVKNKHAFFAEILYKSMKGLGTDNRKLIHTIVSRCEKDLDNIKQQFEAAYRKTLESFIIGDTSGYYKQILLALSGYVYQQSEEDIPDLSESDSEGDN